MRFVTASRLFADVMVDAISFMTAIFFSRSFDFVIGAFSVKIAEY